ncbi:MAG: bifunctional 5,10-methylenetetrahydrofolate dehydrogenase/5,10-methenyltetrahydrofolate cyclohydrolase [Candidatus Omnitrophica bacterium]|nr:bifunctional 5,10-methylenetetrahydrofolate dehydrogenase/5,10-methenyltetrahydrofolate cyclohydrolase [Candidatus Omnitrophota bacterium]
MTSQLLEGKTIAQQIRENIKLRIEAYVAEGKPRPFLQAIQIAADPSAEWYIGQQEKWADKLGIQFNWIKPGTLTHQVQLIDKIKELNEAHVHGIFMAMPLPAGFNADEVLLALDPRKDVEGVHPASLGLIVLRKEKLIPPTAYAAFKLIEATGVTLKGKKAVIVGQSAIVGRPLQLLLGQRRVTTIVCNTGTSAEDIQEYIAGSDIVVGCAGSPGMIKGRWIQPGQIVIDVGTTEVEGKLVGDVEFAEAKEKAAFITPVPGGVGPLTVTMLFENLMRAYEWQNQ